MKRFEYCTITIDSNPSSTRKLYVSGAKITQRSFEVSVLDALNELGEEGWELMAVGEPPKNTDYLKQEFYLKREVLMEDG